MSKKVAINGFGRIGRLTFRQLLDEDDVEVVAINDLGDPENLAYLLRYDTVYGRFDKKVEVRDHELVIEGKVIRMLQEKDPAQLPWKELEVDVVVEATGVFNSYEKARAHVDAGAKRVIISAPSKDEDGEAGKTILMGVNDGGLGDCVISSNGSCTTNSIAGVIRILNQEIGVEKALLNTTHGYTSTQSLVDGPTKKDLRRGRAAAENIIPSSTGAAVAVTKAITELTDKFDGIALRVPVPVGSIADVTFIAKRDTSAEEVNGILRKASEAPEWQGIVGVTDEPLVSSDIIGQSYGAIVDLGMTRVVDGNLVKVLSWYDNEWGYVSTLVKHVLAATKNI